MRHIIKHELSPELAKKASAAAADHYTAKFAKYDASTEWVSDTHADISFHVKGMDVGATIDLEPGQLVVDMEVPLMLLPFKKKALSVIEEVIEKWIRKAKDGELD